ncbi:MULTISPECIES: hypothetical protein [Rhizobium/Agrobacterium group]|uniref:hypothetical protein n=1 Tax=Rhizobium/Agrobacterium group TaxID=227290 RepID=UPI000CF9A3B5|nr:MULTISPECIES: hypothetical protein [Rhizobium/Agrobacterium group]MBY3504007.1 hypothetical protein [Rhizobium laguerreae]
MAFSIGLRVYQVTVYREKDKAPLKLTEDGSATDLFSFLLDFVGKRGVASDREDLQRSWFMEQRGTPSSESIQGYVNYGTYGFESNLVDRKTKKNNYRRKPGDLEEIPLYFKFWMPKGESFGLAAFQSFQARSCVQLVVGSASEMFSTKYKGYRLWFRKLMPEDVKSSALYSAPVKQFTFVKKTLPQTKEDRYLFDVDPDEVEFEVSIKAKRKRSLGTFLSFKEKAGQSSSLLKYDGIQFDEAKAEITVGKKRRTVGVLGYNSDAGVIELSDSVQLGSDGHPNYESIRLETDAIFKDFHSTLAKGK